MLLLLLLAGAVSLISTVSICAAGCWRRVPNLDCFYLCCWLLALCPSSAFCSYCFLLILSFAHIVSAHTVSCSYCFLLILFSAHTVSCSLFLAHTVSCSYCFLLILFLAHIEVQIPSVSCVTRPLYYAYVLISLPPSLSPLLPLLPLPPMDGQQ